MKKGGSSTTVGSEFNKNLVKSDSIDNFMDKLVASTVEIGDSAYATTQSIAQKFEQSKVKDKVLQTTTTIINKINVSILLRRKTILI